MQKSRIATFAFVLAALLAASPASAQLSSRVKVSVTNITKGQILSPAVVATHNNRAPAFYQMGSPASEELAQIAEDAVLQPMIDKLGSSADVLDVQVITGVNGPILPGETASVELEIFGDMNLVSLASMLVVTNDAFVSLNGVRSPNLGTAVHLVPALDAGSEANTESCAHIPGPPCGNGGVRVTEGAEGYVYVSPGITGEGDDLTASGYTWLNPAARISVERLRN